MRKNAQEILISRFIDNDLSPQKRFDVLCLIESNPEAKKCYDDMLFVKKLLQQEHTLSK